MSEIESGFGAHGHTNWSLLWFTMNWNVENKVWYRLTVSFSTRQSDCSSFLYSLCTDVAQCGWVCIHLCVCWYDFVRLCTIWHMVLCIDEWMTERESKRSSLIGNQCIRLCDGMCSVRVCVCMTQSLEYIGVYSLYMKVKHVDISLLSLRSCKESAWTQRDKHYLSFSIVLSLCVCACVFVISFSISFNNL